MSLAAWSTRHLGLLWLGALALAGVLLGAEWLRWAGRPAFFWLLPHPGSPRAAALLARGLVAAAPFAAGAAGRAPARGGRDARLGRGPARPGGVAAPAPGRAAA